MTKRRLFPRTIAIAVPLAAAALIAGCGDDGSSASAEKEEHEAAATPQKAIAEIGQVRAGLAAGLAAYRQGDAGKADELVGDAYLEHFELVEAPLEQRDEELNEELEELIREELRQEIKRGAEESEVARLVREANRELDEAEKALKG
jgi:hypothetical protein